MMKNIKILLFVSICSILYAESLGSINLNYQKSRIKAKAEKYSAKDRVCYQYVEITNTREWNRRKDELNTYIKNNRDRCKKYIIYKEVKNVNIKNRLGSSSSNNSGSEYTINIGVIMEENPEVDIEIYTQVKNSTLQNITFSTQKANIGSVIIEIDDEIDIENRKITAISNVEDSQVGNLDVFSEYGLNKTKEFLKEDKDDPFND
jgi:hypothetical protein